MAGPLRILVAPQSFKGSLDAAAVGEAIAAGIRTGWTTPPVPDITLLPLADGGEGTAVALVTAAGDHGTLIPVTVRGPLPGQQATAQLGWIAADVPTAIVEMAQAAGMLLVPAYQRDVTITSTLGVGDLLRAALDRGARRIYIGLGGSATNDGGMGMATALGARFLDSTGAPIAQGGAALAQLDRIDMTGFDPRLAQVELIGISDVTNVLFGEHGATAVYGPQKGATPEQVAQLDAALKHYALVIARDLGREVAAQRGAGASGGLGAGLLAFGPANTRLEPGASLILQTMDITTRLANTDLVFTGEGRIDGQIAYGKLTGTLAQQAHAAHLPVICVVGGTGPGFEAAYDLGITAIIVAADGPRPLAEAMAHAADLITGSVARALRLWVAVPHA